MQMSDIPICSIESVSLSIMSASTIRKSSCVSITKPNLCTNGIPTDGGPIDLHLGVNDPDKRCPTCFRYKKNCLGHNGSLELRYPYILPLFYDDLKKALKIFCPHCSNVQYSKEYIVNIKNIDKSVNVILKALEYKKNEKCIVCGNILYNYVKNVNEDLFIYYETKEGSKEIFYPHLIENMLNKIDDGIINLIGIDIIKNIKNIISRVFYVCSNKTRPEIKISLEKSVNDPITTHLQLIVKANDNISEVSSDQKTISPDNVDKIRTMYNYITSLLTDKMATPMNNNYNKRGTIISPTNKSIIEKIKHKDGIIRKNMLGKRVSGISRGVIICDPTLELDTIKISVKFAKNITYEEDVTELNRDILTKHMLNGNNYPGAEKYIEKTFDKQGKPINKTYSLQYKNNTNIILKNGDKVFRHLVTGDILYFNRQPSLTYSSICGVKVIVNEDPHFNAIAMNVLVCKFFNADFDGDQMNCLILNSKPARVEAELIGSISSFIVSKQYGSMHIGQSYDSIIGSLLTTRSEVRINLTNACKILSSVKDLNKKNYDVNKTLLEELFDLFKDDRDKLITGRDLISLLIPKKIDTKNKCSWYNKNIKNSDKIYKSDERVLEIKSGKILSGVIDKASVGEGGIDTSIYNIINKLYSSGVTMNTIYNMQQACLEYSAKYQGFSLGLNDIMVGYDNIQIIKDNILKDMIERMNNVYGSIINKTFKYPIGTTKAKYFETRYIEEGAMQYINIADYIDIEKNNLMKLALSGSKGKLNQIYEMLAIIGFKMVDGSNLIPSNKFSYSRTSPFFRRYDISYLAKGFVTNSYFIGCDITQYLVMCMTARRDIIVKALLTAHAGDQNRKSTKNLESVVATYTNLVSNKMHIIQYMYSDNGIDSTETVKLNLIDIMLMSYEDFKKKVYYNDKEFNKILKFRDIILKTAIQYTKINYHSNSIEDVCKFHLPFHIDLVIKKYSKSNVDNNVNMSKVFDKVDKFCNDLKFMFFNDNVKNNNLYVPSVYESAIFLIEFILRLYLSTKYIMEYKIHYADLDNIFSDIRLHFVKSLIKPGTPIGILTAQCISEPMTQNALDTHRGSANEGGTKSGMKRIKEILGNKKPDGIDDLNMTIVLKGDLKYDKEANKAMSNYITMVKFKDMITVFQIFYEEDKINKLTHPKYKHEQALIDKFIKFNPGYTYNIKSLTNYVVRIVINKLIMFNKNIKLNQIIKKLNDNMKDSYIVYSNENSKDIIIYIFISDNYIEKNNKININKRDGYTERILYYQQYLYNNITEINIVGIPGIISSNVIELKNKYKYNGKELVLDKYYVINTVGTNFQEIYLLNQIDHSLLQTDDIYTYAMLYGIDAVKLKISYELKDLIGENIINKHYLLTADNMTRHGFITSFEKYGLNSREPDNILLRLGTSHPRQVISDAAINNKSGFTDGLTPSLIVGTAPSSFGTCYSGVYIDVEKMIKQ